MYVSDYFNIVNLENGEYVLVHSFLGSIDLLEDEYAKILIDYKGDNKKIDNNILPSSIRETLLEKGYLVSDKSIDRKNFLKIADKLSRMKKRVKSYTIIPSYECNFRCSYCFELGTIEKNNSQIMTKETVDILFERIDEEIKNNFGIVISLFGGEPFLPKNKEIITYILAKAKERKIKVSAITNGFYLDYYKDLLTFDSFDNIQITLDGSKKVHDKRRVLKGNIGTYDKIIESIRLILGQKNPPNITVRVNIDERNVDAIDSLIKEFETNAFTGHKRFSFYTKCVHTCYTKSKIKFYDSDIVKQNSNNKNSNVSYQRIYDDVRKILNQDSLGFFRTSSCGAVNGMLVIDAMGNLYSCYEEANNKNLAVGKINYENRSFDLNNAYLDWNNRSIQKIDKCSKCSYALVCGGGCPKHAKVYNGSIYSANCEDFKKIYSQVLKEVILSGEY